MVLTMLTLVISVGDGQHFSVVKLFFLYLKLIGICESLFIPTASGILSWALLSAFSIGITLPAGKLSMGASFPCCAVHSIAKDTNFILSCPSTPHQARPPSQACTLNSSCIYLCRKGEGKGGKRKGDRVRRWEDF